MWQSYKFRPSLTWKSGHVKAQQCLTPQKQSWYTLPEMKPSYWKQTKRPHISNLARRAQAEVKILGVVLDQRLSYKQHIAQAAKRGIKAALALKRLKNLRPEIPRQLFVSTTAPVVDYASPISASDATILALRNLDNVQRIGTQAGIGGSSTVTRCVAESKAGVEPAILRHHNQQRAAWIKWHTKPESHCF